MPIKQKHFYMMRHGQTEANASHIMAGSLDSPLTAKGRDQAYQAQKALLSLDVKPSIIVHSHLSRARDTAAILNEALNLEMIEDADLAEFHAGEWEGVSYEICREMLYGWMDAPGGETCEQFTTRIIRGKNRHLDRPDGPALIVCHGGVLRAFGYIYGIPTPGAFENCQLHEFHPRPAHDAFPWQVWQYDVRDDQVVKTQARNYPNFSESKKKSA